MRLGRSLGRLQAFDKVLRQAGKNLLGLVHSAGISALS